jgi:hypothetical protein
MVSKESEPIRSVSVLNRPDTRRLLLEAEERGAAERGVMTRTNKPGQEQRWAEAQRRCRLSDEAVRMAKELGLNPRSLIKNIPSPKQRWKAPVEDWVRDIYRRRHDAKPRRGKATTRSDDG